MNTSDYDFIRNDFLLTNPIKIGNIAYETVEHAFQAAKTTDRAIKESIADSSVFGARDIGKALPLPDDWNTKRLFIMESLVRAKFTENLDLQDSLLQTGTDDIVMNHRSDLFWGFNGTSGENNLGKILMKVRAELSFLRDNDDSPEEPVVPKTLTERMKALSETETFDCEEDLEDLLHNLSTDLDQDTPDLDSIKNTVSTFIALYE